MMTVGSTPDSSADMQEEQVPILPSPPPAPSAQQNGPTTPTPEATLTSILITTGSPPPAETDEIQPVQRTYGATDTDTASTKKGKSKGDSDDKEGKNKRKKSGQKAVADALKTDMAAERTFFKWLWTGLHTGAIGSFIFITFDGDKEDPMRLVVVGFSWFVALLLVLYGTFAYYRRRWALRTGDISRIPSITREHSPLIVVTALALVVGAALGYASLSGFRANKGVAFGAG